MNYRHVFHAGNFADVFKHTILIGLLEALKEKVAPFCYFDTHAGAGSYDLRGEEARKTGEFDEGVMRVLDATQTPAMLRIYLDLLRALNPADAAQELTTYPGSPLVASQLLRAHDRAVLCETQNDEAAQLKTLFADDPRVGVHHRDGYAALGALLPPKERRGLVLIDPPFEAQEAEFRVIESAVQLAYTRWPTGTYAIWYPIKLGQAIQPFHRWFVKRDIHKVLVAELLRQPDNSALRLNGCGMVIVNPPWKFDLQLAELLPVLQQRLAFAGEGQHRIQWLTRGAG